MADLKNLSIDKIIAMLLPRTRATSRITTASAPFSRACSISRRCTRAALMY